MSVVVDRSAARERRRGRGCFVWAATLTVAGIAIALIFACAAYVWRAERSTVEQALADARATGAPVTVEEIEAYYPTDPKIEEATRHWQKAIDSIDPNERIPWIGEKGGDSEAAASDGESSESSASEDLRIAREFVEGHRQAIEASHEARRAGAVARFPVAFEEGYFALRPHLTGLRTLAGVVSLDVQVRLADGEIEEAVEDVLTAVAIAESLSNEPETLAQLTRIGCFHLASQGAERLFGSDRISDDQVVAIGEAFAGQRFDDGLRRSIVGERFCFMQALTSDDPPENEQVAKVRSLGPRTDDVRDGLELFRRAELACDRGTLAVAAEGEKLEDDIVAFAKDPESLRRHAGIAMLFPALRASALAALRAEAISVLTETAAACERYRLANGELPPTLDSLVPEYLVELPIDPFDEKPLRYVLRDDGATLYSIGKDFSDEGGLVDYEDADDGPCDELFLLRPSDAAQAPAISKP